VPRPTAGARSNGGLPEALVATGSAYSSAVAKRNWIQEERRRTLGDWVALCPSCGHVARYFETHENERPTVCPQCSTALVARCPSCDARLPSAFQVECEECGAELRPNELFGGPIRRAGR
jgi:RNase P subunit RPR2